MEPELTVGEFVGLLNQTLDYAYNGIVITGELANLRVSKGKWVYFDLKDETASVKFFGTVYMLPGPLEDGMLLKVRGQPRLHNLYGFSVNVQSIQPAGEGTIKRAAELLQAKLVAEGLFAPERKRQLPYPPQHIGLVASKQSAAYADFIKIINARWGGLLIEHIDVQVQGEIAPAQIVAAIEQFNGRPEPPEVLVIIRGGGSAEDLAAFSSELVTRAVAASRVPTLAAIGHEIDVSLAELAADLHASTPSNAAELLVPDRRHYLENVTASRERLNLELAEILQLSAQNLDDARSILGDGWQSFSDRLRQNLHTKQLVLGARSPRAALERGYAVLRSKHAVITTITQLQINDEVNLQLVDGLVDVSVKAILPANDIVRT